MKPVRTAARVLLATHFVVTGIQVLLQPDHRIEQSKRVTDQVGPLIEKLDPRLPSDARSLVRIKAGADVAAGLLLATGRLTRPAAAVLAAGLVPAMVAEGSEGIRKTLGLLGGLLLAAVDTQGRPGLSYRTTHAVDRSQRSMRRAVR